MQNELSLACAIRDLAHKVETNDFVVDRTGVKTVELLAPRIVLDPRQPFLKFGEVRKTPMKYCLAELEWYNSQDRSVDMIAPYAKMWSQVASKSGTVNSNYGWCIYSVENHSQFDHVVRELQENPQSRRATMIYNRPSMWLDHNQNGMNDFMCTFATQHMIRDEGHGPRLATVVNMRSNDLIFGFTNDFFWQCNVHDKLITELQRTYPDLRSGRMVWIANSLHVYERHFEMLLGMRDWVVKQQQRNMTALKDHVHG